MCRSAGKTCGICLILALMPAPPTEATPYLISYEADTPGSFPEDEGWERFTTGGGASRAVENGILTLQAINEPPNGGSDQYVYDMQEQLNPDPGEFFFAEWRMRLLPGSASSDVGVFIDTDNAERQFGASYAESAFGSPGDGGGIVLLDTTVFRTYRLESFDMIDYTLSIDGALAWEGVFISGTISSSLVGFGDRGIGGASSSEWDYFRFGVVTIPEPPGVAGAALGLLGWSVVARRRYSR